MGRARGSTAAKLVVAALVTTAAHLAVEPVRIRMTARSARMADVDLHPRERALAACLVGGPLAEGEEIDDRVLGIETALVVRGAEVRNDATHWPGRCAQLARSAAALSPVGRSSMNPGEVETLSLVLGHDRPLEAAQRAIARLTSLPAPRNTDDPIAEEALAAAGGPPPDPWHPALPRTSLKPWRQVGVEILRTARVSEHEAVAVWSDRPTMGGRRAVYLSHRPGEPPRLRLGAAPELPPFRRCFVGAGDWLLAACGPRLLAIEPRRARQPWLEPRSDGLLLGSLDVAFDGALEGAVQWGTECREDGRVAAVSIAAQNPRERARLVVFAKGAPQGAHVPTAPADHLRCWGKAEVLGVRPASNGTLEIQRDRCDEAGCVTRSIDVDALVGPPALRPRSAADIAVAPVGDGVAVVWRSPHHGVFLKRGAFDALVTSPTTLLARPLRQDLPTSIASFATASAAAFVLLGFHGEDHALVTLVGDEDAAPTPIEGSP